MTKAPWIVFDIESRATRCPNIIDLLTEQARTAKPNHNTLKELKASWDSPEAIQERIDAAIAKTALDPLHAEVLCICASCLEGEVVVLDGMEQTPHRMLLEMRDLIANDCDRDTLWTGFNIERFDLSLLLVQFQKTGIAPPEFFPTYRRGKWRGNVFDTMSACPGRTPFISLIEASLAYGLIAKSLLWRGERMTGARVGEAYEAGAYQIIRDYCCGDVRDETALFLVQTCGGVWGIQSRTDTTAEQLTEIAESTLTPGQKWTAAMPILQSYGLLT